MLVFFNDILIHSKTSDNHLDHVKVVKQVLKSNSLYAKQSKCRF